MRLEQIESALHAVVPVDDTLTAVFLQVIDRLEFDFDPQVSHKVLSLLASAKEGLSERELLELLARLLPSQDAKRRDEEMQVVLRQVRSYLMRKGQLLDFYHRSFWKAVQNAYLQTDVQRHAAHEQLANYFRHKADPDQDNMWKGAAARPLVELPYHLALSGAVNVLRAVLSDLHYLDSRLLVAEVYGLLADYGLLSGTDDECTTDFCDLLLRNAQSLSLHRGTLFSLAYHEGSSAIRRRATEVADQGDWHQPWFRVRPCWVPDQPVEPHKSTISITSFCSCDWNCASALAKARRWAFYIPSLGGLAIVNVATVAHFPFVYPCDNNAHLHLPAVPTLFTLWSHLKTARPIFSV